jgi:hypothetical protein
VEWHGGVGTVRRKRAALQENPKGIGSDEKTHSWVIVDQYWFEL